MVVYLKGVSGVRSLAPDSFMFILGRSCDSSLVTRSSDSSLSSTPFPFIPRYLQHNLIVCQSLAVTVPLRRYQLSCQADLGLAPLPKLQTESQQIPLLLLLVSPPLDLISLPNDNSPI